MGKFIRNLLAFALPIILYSILAATLMPYFLSLANGPSTKQQITYSFENAINNEYEMLILGNSRTYRGINPDSFQLKSFNFSHDADSYNQIYYKLKFLIDNQKSFNYVILGLDYFQFSFKSNTRNYVYADFFDSEYMNDFENSALIKKLEYHFSNINPKKILSCFPTVDKPFMRKNGQFIKPGFAREDNFVSRNIKRLGFQVKYFEKILEVCKSKGIKVFLVTLPTRINELNSYKEPELVEFNDFINQYVDDDEIFYLNYSHIKGFETKDYTDITHLNEAAANRFTKKLDKDLMGLIREKK